MIRRKPTLEQRIARLENLLNSNDNTYTRRSILERRVSILEEAADSKSALEFIKKNIASHVHGYVNPSRIQGFDTDDEYFGVNNEGITTMNFIIIVEASLKDGSKQYYPVYVKATVEDGKLRVRLSGIGEKTAKVAGLQKAEELLWAIEDLKAKLLKEFRNKDITKLLVADYRDIEDGDVELEEETFNNSKYAK